MPYREHNGSQRKGCIPPFASGMKNVMMGIRMSATRAETRLPVVPPMMTAMAKPTTPYLLRNSMNWFINPFGVARVKDLLRNILVGKSLRKI